MRRHDNDAQVRGRTVAGGSVAPAECDASGWAMGVGCLSGDRSIVCPSCDRVVLALPHRQLGLRVAVVPPHQAASCSDDESRVA